MVRQSLTMPPISWMHAFVDVRAERAEEARSFWSSVLGWPSGDAWPGHPEFVSFVPENGAPYVHVQRIDGPPRVHLDLVGEIERDTARLEELGATRVYRGAAWQAMASPAGLPFCVCAETWPHERPKAVTWPGGHRSRLVQLTVDVPNDQYDRELEFWRPATGWADEVVDAPEFHRLVHRRESPLQLLVQRLGADDGAQQARAHLDLGTDDMDAELGRVRSLGARLLWTSAGFVALRDPLGLPFCVTANDPAR
jgi:catechol 2,3-dioxygenase-like lactoylglutathione lyase family enzyme